ncbi:uncharacterized protein Dsimw501_GD27071 [Drosophila simulans]|uniref:Uncharacterized protein n=1 Tax=Drosophila simulans TaxID=7240 RepID=A0A0J9RRK7_DROSI|nr:uncharacterized protein Dsimw501_GD27071 [Drosophila simulans]
MWQLSGERSVLRERLCPIPRCRSISYQSSGHTGVDEVSIRIPGYEMIPRLNRSPGMRFNHF